jgi:histidyl-tRNA synthetase
MRTAAFVLGIVLIVLVSFSPASGQVAASKVLPSGAKVYIAPMPDGFDEFLKAAIEKKKVPVELVSDKDKAEFQITGQAETQKASTAKKVIMWDWRSNEQASIQVGNLQTGEVVFAYSVNKVSSAHGKKSSAEACAKHIKEKIESQK